MHNTFSPLFHFPFLLYFIDYAVTVVLIFFPFLPSAQQPHSLRQFPHHRSCPWVMCMSSLATPFPILYFTSPWLFYNYLSFSFKLFVSLTLNCIFCRDHIVEFQFSFHLTICLSFGCLTHSLLMLLLIQFGVGLPFHILFFIFLITFCASVIPLMLLGGE